MCRVCWQADPEWKDKYCVRRAYDPAHRELDTAGGLTHPASSSDEEVVPMSNSERVTFAGSSGSLSGRLETPEQPPTTWAVFAHCFTCGKDNSAAARISRALTGSGIGVLRFDFTGLGTPRATSPRQDSVPMSMTWCVQPTSCERATVRQRC